MSTHEQNQDYYVKEILLSTGNVNRPYIVRDIAFATETFDLDVFNESNDLNELLSGVKQQLKDRAASYGASAVINCHFDHNHINDGEHKYIKIFAYGTIVQYTQTTIG